MAVGVFTAGLATSAVFGSIAVVIVLIIVLLLCGDKNKSDSSEPQLVQQNALPEPAVKVSPTDVIVEVETGETTKRQSNGSAVGAGSQRNSAKSDQRNSNLECNGTLEQRQSQGPNRISTASETVNTGVVPYEDEGEDDYDHIQRKQFHPKSPTGNPYNKVNPDGKVGSADPYSRVVVKTTDSASGAGVVDDGDEDYAIVDSPTRDSEAFNSYYSTVDKKPTTEGESGRDGEEEDYGGDYAEVDKNKMLDAKANRTKPMVDVEEDETYAEITPPPVPEKNFDDINGHHGNPALKGPSTVKGVDDMLPTAGSLPPMRPLDPEPPYSAVTARESLESIRQRKDAAASEIVEEDYYSTVGGESGDGTVVAIGKRTSVTSDLYDEIKGLSGDGTVGPPPVNVDHLKRITQLSKQDEAPTNVVSEEAGHLYAQVNKKNKRDSTSNENAQTPSYYDTGYDNVQVESRSRQLSASRKGYEMIDLDKDNVTRVGVHANEEEEDDPNYDTVNERTMDVFDAADGGNTNGETVTVQQSDTAQGSFVTKIQIGSVDNATVLSHAKRSHQYEDIDRDKRKESTGIHCDTVAQI